MTMKTFCDIVKLFDFSDLITFYYYIILNTILIGITKYRIVIDEMDRSVNSQVSLQHNKQLPYFSAISRFSASGLFTSSGFGSPPLSPPPGMGGLSLINQVRGRGVTCYCAVLLCLAFRSNWSLGCTRTKTRRNLISRNRSMLLCCTWRWYSEVAGGGADLVVLQEMRPKVVAECTLKESAAINQILGRKVNHCRFFWNTLYIFLYSYSHPAFSGTRLQGRSRRNTTRRWVDIGPLYCAAK